MTTAATLSVLLHAAVLKRSLTRDASLAFAVQKVLAEAPVEVAYSDATRAVVAYFVVVKVVEARIAADASFAVAK